MEWIYAIASIASGLAAVLAWAAKIWWGREHIAAKNEIIKAKEAEIETLKTQYETIKELSSPLLREYHRGVREELEEYIEKLKLELNKKEDQIKKIQAGKKVKTHELKQLEHDKGRIQETVTILENKVKEFHSKSKEIGYPHVPKYEDLLKELAKKPIINNNKKDHSP
jgi:chromosome segregation ATPase